MIRDVEKKIRKVVKPGDYEKGLLYDEDYVVLQSIDEKKDASIYHFMIRSEQTYRFYRAEIMIQENEITRTFCTCPQFILNHSCKHVAASLILFSNELFEDGKENRFLIQSKNFLSRNANLGSSRIKKRLNLVVEIETEKEYKGEHWINFKIGEEHLYTMRNKFSDFIEAYYDPRKKVVFGKFLTYSSNDYYFSKTDSEIIEFLEQVNETNYYRYYSNGIRSFHDADLKRLLKLLEEKTFFINGKEIIKIEKGSPIQYYLTKKDDTIYRFSYDQIEPLTNDYSYLTKDQICYQIPTKERNLLQQLKEEGLQEVLFEREDLSNFEKVILPAMKEKLKISEEITDLAITEEPTVQLYFDFADKITCDITFLYGDEEIHYFDQTSFALRDVEFENQVLMDLYEYQFQISEKEIFLEDIDFIGDFLDYGLTELSKKYEVFTSEKIKNTSLLKKNHVMSTFRIGKDNIMNYHFSIDGVEDQDLSSLLGQLKKKKRYYKLKNGNVISLQNEKMEELKKLTEELELNEFDGVIPKYRALYLESLKSHYSIIETDDNFKKFIENFKNYQTIELNFDTENILRNYQKIGVKWLYQIYKCDFGGILADEMGLGKSIQLIYFIKELLKESMNHQVLIVVPTSLMYNWKNEFDKFGNEISYSIVAGNKKSRKELLKKDVNVYITSYGLLREDIELYLTKQFKACVIDEAQNIKNMNAGITKAVKKVQSDVKFALTGTPIENSTLELYSIFDFVMPGFLGTSLNFQSKYQVKDFDEETNLLLDNLNHLISPFILRRKKTEVVKELPPKLENNIFIDLNEEQKKLYMAEVEYVKKEMDRLIKEEGFTKASFLILQLLTRLRQLCIDPKILFEDYDKGSSKIEELIKVVKESIHNGHKILIFTSFKTALEIVKKEFQKEKITCYQIDGSVPSKKRMELVEKFNEDDTNVFLIMLKSGGTGLNLTSADVVIHLDLWWNPQAENQATDRTHRIGQTKVVEVIRLVSRGTIEEHILELQQKKKLLSDKIIEGKTADQNILSKLTEEDIRGLLSFENKE